MNKTPRKARVAALVLVCGLASSAVAATAMATSEPPSSEPADSEGPLPDSGEVWSGRGSLLASADSPVSASPAWPAEPVRSPPAVPALPWSAFGMNIMAYVIAAAMPSRTSSSNVRPSLRGDASRLVLLARLWRP